jgi:hypothetical protein
VRVSDVGIGLAGSLDGEGIGATAEEAAGGRSAASGSIAMAMASTTAASMGEQSFASLVNSLGPCVLPDASRTKMRAVHRSE